MRSAEGNATPQPPRREGRPRSPVVRRSQTTNHQNSLSFQFLTNGVRTTRLQVKPQDIAVALKLALRARLKIQSFSDSFAASASAVHHPLQNAKNAGPHSADQWSK